MVDIASQEDKRGVYLDNVGITALKMPISVRDKSERSVQNTIGTFNAFVDLPNNIRGTHMSRIVEVLYRFRTEINQAGLKGLTKELIEKLGAQRSRVEVEFPYFTDTWSPISNSQNMMTHLAWFEAESHLERSGGPTPIENETFTLLSDFRLGVSVDIMTVCPCAKEECGNGNSHVQRGKVCIYVKPKAGAWVWLEDLIEIAQKAGSSPVYDRLKREDEKDVVCKGFENPKFVEDVCRDVVVALETRNNIDAYKVVVENYESIHTHNASASKAFKWY